MSMRIPSSSVALGDTGLTLVGRSRAGDGTSFCIPELKWIFDCGAVVQGGVGNPTHIFLTHTHADHVTFLAQFQPESHTKNKNSATPTVYLPNEALPFVDGFLKAHQALVEMSLETVPDKITSLNLTPVRPGQEFSIEQRGGREYKVVPILADHRIQCYGYSVFRTKKKLKEEFAVLAGHEIGRLRKKGIDIYDSFREPVFCYIGDSTHRVFENNPDILRWHRVVVTECSFIGDNDVKRAEETQHTHWTNLQPIVEAHPQTLFILIHFSLKHAPLTLLEFFNKQTCRHRNVHPMLVRQEMEQEWRERGFSPDIKLQPTCRCFQCAPS